MAELTKATDRPKTPTYSSATRRKPPRRPNMSKMLTKVAGMAILVATIGVASCQALIVEAPGIKLPIEQVQ